LLALRGLWREKKKKRKWGEGVSKNKREKKTRPVGVRRRKDRGQNTCRTEGKYSWRGT